MIPNIIHQIWVGSAEIPAEFLTFSKQWKLLYSDFSYQLWTDDNCKVESLLPGNLLPYYFDQKFSVAFKADLLRYFLINKYGGIYIDMDTEPLRRMDAFILNHTCFSGIQPNSEVAIGIFGSIKDSELLTDVCNNIHHNIETLLNAGVNHRALYRLSGPEYFNAMCNKYRNNEKYLFAAPKYFYPYWFDETHRRRENFKLTCPDAYSVHHWAHSWKS